MLVRADLPRRSTRRPRHILRHVPASPPLDLVSAYARAVYRVALDDRELAFTFGAIGTKSTLAPPWPDAWAILTAWNPGPQRLSDHQNQQRNSVLHASLERLGVSIRPSIASDRLGGHLEPGFAAIGLDRTRALALARRFAQHAIILGHGPKTGLLIVRTDRWNVLPMRSVGST
jgi:hypothetical protein